MSNRLLYVSDKPAYNLLPFFFSQRVKGEERNTQRTAMVPTKHKELNSKLVKAQQ